MRGASDKKWLTFRSLHMKLVLILVLLIVSVMAVVGTFLFNRVNAYYYDDFTSQMNAAFNTNMYTMLQNEAVGEDGAARLKSVLGAYSTSLGISSERNFYILDGKTGTPLAGTTDDIPERTAAIVAALDGQVGQEKSAVKDYMDRAVPIIVEGEVLFVVYIKDTKHEIQRLVTSLFTIILQAMLVGLVIAIFLSLLLSKTITTPIENLTKSAKSMGEGEFESKIEVHSDDEIGTLTDTFNTMAQTLKETMETVEGERNKLNALFLHMTDGVASFGSDGKVLQLNPAACEFLGISQDEEHRFEDIFASLDLSFDAVRSLGANDYIDRDLFTGGRTLRVSFATVGAEVAILAVIHDITEQFKLETSRREFVANVSHELRTPLTNVKSYAETLLDMCEPEDEMKKNFYGVIINETDRMTRIVKDLLILSRLDYAKMDWKISRFSLDESLRNVVLAMEMDAKNHKHELTLELPEPLPEMNGDKGRVEQVFVNILSNAIKYTPDGGKITVTGKNKGGKAEISVRDTGIGIPKKDLERIFDRFYRVDKARSRARGGTGLGLAITKEIVEHHGGTISVESELNVGTTVTICFDVNREVQYEN